jgi:hypothetical protein
MRQRVYAIETGFKLNSAIPRFQDHSIVVAGFDAHMRPQGQREVDGHGAGVKQVKGPDIYGAARKVDTSWSRRFNNHFFIPIEMMVDFGPEFEI